MNAKTPLILAGLAGFAVMASAQAPAILYLAGKSAADQQIGFRSWGSGTIHETNEAAFEGTTSISVSTRNLFQGGIMMYANPIDLSPQFGDKNNLLRITFKLADASQVLGGGGGPAGGIPGSGGRGAGGVGGAGLPPTGGRGGGQGDPQGNGRGGPGGTLGGRGGQGGSGVPGGLGGLAGGGSAPKEAEMKLVRLIVTTSDGKKSEVYVPVSSSMSGERGWRMVSIPLQAIRGFDRTNKSVKEIAVSADAMTTMYIGDMRVVNDATPITGEIVQKGPVNLALGDELNLSAYGFGGSSPLRFLWDFDSKDGIQVDAEGQSILRKFRKAGHFTITLTVVDAYGLKAPVTSTLEVQINP